MLLGIRAVEPFVAGASRDMAQCVDVRSGVGAGEQHLAVPAEVDLVVSGPLRVEPPLVVPLLLDAMRGAVVQQLKGRVPFVDRHAGEPAAVEVVDLPELDQGQRSEEILLGAVIIERRIFVRDAH